MDYQAKHLDGTPIHNDGRTYTIDNTIQTFIVQVRSLGSIGEDTIKDLIQQKYEVTKVEEINRTDFVM